MTAIKLPESLALSEGSSLWILQNNPANYWWKKLDFRTSYLLTQNTLVKKTPISPQLRNILSETNLVFQKNNFSFNYYLVGTENHFLNKWILLWDDLNDAEVLQLIEQSCQKLNAQSIRFFSHHHLAQKLLARPSTSSLSISYIEYN